MSNFKQVVIDFLVSKLPVIYHPLLSPYLALSKNIGKNNTTLNVSQSYGPSRPVTGIALLYFYIMFVVKATYIESTDLPCLLRTEKFSL
jgi:hypothetical protein